MTSVVDGKTRIFAILGDPVTQVKSPANVTASLRARSRNAILIPAHVKPADFDRVVDALGDIDNLDGMVITVPHKFAAFRCCAKSTERASFLGAVNVIRRMADGGWYGDMCDGQGFVDAIIARGAELKGRRASLLGAGGAGSAIGYALLEAGVAELSIHDADGSRRDDLIGKLGRRFEGRVKFGTSDPIGFEVIANATPIGMEDPDDRPFDLTRLQPGMIVGDVVTPGRETALIRAARAIHCIAASGHDMYSALQETLVNFLLAA